MAETSSIDSILQNGITFRYSYCRSRRKSLAVTVKPDKTISVRVPMRTPLSRIRAFVESRTDWIIKIWNRLDEIAPRPQQGYVDGSRFLFQGHEYGLKLAAGDDSVCIADEQLVVTTGANPCEGSIRCLIDDWYRKQAGDIIRVRAAACHRLMEQEQMPLPPFTIRSMRSRWGSYSYRTARICLNLNLVMAPLACLDYVIVHELCHIKVRHHGPDFWIMVRRYVPDYPALRQQLKEFHIEAL